MHQVRRYMLGSCLIARRCAPVSVLASMRQNWNLRPEGWNSLRVAHQKSPTGAGLSAQVAEASTVYFLLLSLLTWLVITLPTALTWVLSLLAGLLVLAAVLAALTWLLITLLTALTWVLRLLAGPLSALLATLIVLTALVCIH